MITHGVVVVVRRWLLVLILLCYVGIVSISGNKLDDVYKQLKHLNKPALKSIKSPDGDIIDCVHISHQPAFDHPLLKNHTIQMRPSYHPESDEGISKSITQLWHLNGRCPEGTIPIRRTKKKEILRASSIKSFGRKQHGTIPEPTMPTKPEPIGPHEISGGWRHTMALTSDGKLYGWGWNKLAVLGGSLLGTFLSEKFLDGPTEVELRLDLGAMISKVLEIYLWMRKRAL